MNNYIIRIIYGAIATTRPRVTSAVHVSRAPSTWQVITKALTRTADKYSAGNKQARIMTYP